MTSKCCWIFKSLALTISLFVTLLYWTIVHQYVVEHMLLLNTEDWIYNIFLHAFNSMFVLLDLWFCSIPVKPLHCYLPLVFGISYSTFTFFYWSLGGEGICASSCHEEDKTIPLQLAMMSTSNSSKDCTVQCASFIYPVLDWENSPEVAVSISIGGSFACVIIHLCLYGLHKLKLYIYDFTN